MLLFNYYLRDIKYRVFYIFNSFFFSFFFFFIFKKYVIFILFKTLNKFRVLEHLIFTNLLEFFYIEVFFIFFVTLMINLPFIIYIFFCFFISMLRKSYYFEILIVILLNVFCIISIFYFSNYFIYSFIKFFVMFEDLNLNDIIQINIEIQIKEYIKKIILIYFISLIILLLIFLLNILNIRNKKINFYFFIYFFILLLFPPDLFLHLFIFIFFFVINEIFIFFKIILKTYLKNLYICKKKEKN